MQTKPVHPTIRLFHGTFNHSTRGALFTRPPSTTFSPPIPITTHKKLHGYVYNTRNYNHRQSKNINSGISHDTNGNSNETFQQLRQAVLSSLDFSDNTDQIQEWDESLYDSAEDVSQIDPQAAAAAVGKAVYETLRIDKAGKTRRVYVRRRDLIRSHGLQPRDLRSVDPSLSPTKTSPSVTIKEECVLINIGGVRAVITADRCLLFEPSSASSRKFVELVMPRLHRSAVDAARRSGTAAFLTGSGVSGSIDAEREILLSRGVGGGEAVEDPGYASTDSYDMRNDVFPFELEVLEAALMVATGKLEGELVAATRRVGAVLQKLPREITPVNLEELRRVKQLLVELESKAENLRDLLEELMDDEDEVRELNLSSRPKREEKRRQRERERIEREMEREWAERGIKLVDGLPGSIESGTISGGELVSGSGTVQNGSSASSQGGVGEPDAVEDSLAIGDNTTADTNDTSDDGNGIIDQSQSTAGSNIVPLTNSEQAMLQQKILGIENAPDGVGSSNPASSDGGFQEAQDALEEMMEEEEEERELEEVEDLLEYYLQRAATTQSEAERLLAGARDLEESIGVSLSARRFEVNRLELLLSMASFAAALGAMVASIFGMNLRSTLEMSVVGFWGTTSMIVAGSVWVFWVLYKYTKGKRIL